VSAAQKEKAMAWYGGVAKKILKWPVTARENMDGIKLYFGAIGWVLVRASGTENLLRVYSETPQVETTRRVLAAVAEQIHEM
jgi:phosphomannomutase